MIEVKELYEFELENGQPLRSSDNNILLLIKENLKENEEKIVDYYKVPYSHINCNFSEGLTFVCNDGFFGYIDKDGKEKISFIYGDAGIFKEGLAPVEKSSKYGYIDKNGGEKIPFQYDYAHIFCEGFAIMGIVQQRLRRWKGRNTQWQMLSSSAAGSKPVNTMQRFANCTAKRQSPRSAHATCRRCAISRSCSEASGN